MRPKAFPGLLAQQKTGERKRKADERGDKVAEMHPISPFSFFDQQIGGGRKDEPAAEAAARKGQELHVYHCAAKKQHGWDGKLRKQHQGRRVLPFGDRPEDAAKQEKLADSTSDPGNKRGENHG